MANWWEEAPIVQQTQGDEWWAAAPVVGQPAPQPQPEPVQERGFRQRLYDNIIGDPNDGVTSTGEALGTWLNRAGESMTLGIIGDEANAAATGMLPGRSYESELERYRANEAAMSTLGGLSADLTGAIVPAAAGIGLINQAVTTPGRMIRGAQLGAAAGATQGFMEGEDGLMNRAQSGLVGGGLGGTLGGVIPGISEVGRQLYRTVEGGLRNSRVGRTLANDLGVSPQAGRFIGDAVGAEDRASMAQALGRAGPDAMLADASPAMAGRLDAAMRSPVAGAGLARERVDARAGNAYNEIIDALNGGQQGPRMPPVEAQRRMAAGARPTINAEYRKAYNTPIDYSSEAGRAIEDIVGRLPPGTARQAIQRATDRMTYDGAPNAQLMARVSDDGRVSFEQMPNVMQLDYLKRAFDEIADAGKDPITGRLSADGAFASRIARDIREATAEAVPSYRDALRTAASDIRERGAMRTGSTLLRPQTTVEEAAEAIGDATPAELRAMRQGVMGQIDHVLGNVRAVATDQNIDARQAMQALRELSSPNSQRKLEGLFGDDWPGVKQSIDRASAALGLRAGTASNSATASRLFADREIQESVTPGALRQGKPLEAAKEFIGGITGASPEAIARSRDEVKAEIADLLTRQGGAPQQTIDAVVRALMANPSNPTAGNTTRDLMTVLGLSGNQAIVEQLQRTLGTMP